MDAPREFRGTARFEILRCLGKGGMGVVYEALDRERNTRVALKTLPTLDPAALYRFKKEFRALAGLSHPNLIPLHELMTADDSWFFTMEILDDPVDFLRWVRPPGACEDARVEAPSGPGSSAGEATRTTLDATLVSGSGAAGRALTPAVLSRKGAAPPELDRLRAAFLGLIAGVEAIHGAGKLHRDLKPANVLVRPDGRVTILDFGLIAAVSEPALPEEPRDNPRSSRSMMSTDQGVSGTVSFMAPEQARGEPLGPEADAYAIGVMLFQALTGSLPFSGSAADVLLRKQVARAPRASELADRVPDELDALAAALLAPDPGDRPSLAFARAVLLGEEAPITDRFPAQRIAGEDLIGREGALQALAAALEACRRGAVICRLRGPSGAGKTALLEHFVGALPPGILLLRGRCLEQESVPFKALDGVIDALTHHLLLLAPEERSALLPEGLPALTRMFPVLGRVVPEDAATLDVQALRRRGLQALAALLEALGGRDVVAVHLDDLQWSDVDGAALLGELLVELARRQARCLVLLGYRSEYEGRSPGLAALERALRGAAGLDDRSLEVGGLTPADAERLAGHLLPGAPEEQRRWIAGASEGLPWLIHELARSVRAGVVQVGASAAGVLERRAAALPPEARQILDLVAVAGQPLRLRQVRAALALESLPEGPLRALRAGSWVRGSGPGLEDTMESFHDRVREGITAALPAARRRELHRALARALAADEAPEVVAEHHEAAGEPGAAAALYERAADEARAVLALARAERLYERAAGLSAGEDRARVVEKQIHYLTDVARFSEAYGLGRRALAGLGVSLPERASPPPLLAGLARILWSMRGRTPSSLLDLPPMTDPRARAAVRMMAACMKAAYQLQPELCVMVANESVELCLRHGNPEDAALGYMVHGTIFRGGVLGRHRTGHAFGALARALVVRHRNERQRAEVLFVVGYFGTSWVEPAVAAEALWDEAFQAGLRSGDLFHTGCAACGTVASLWMRGAPLPEILRRAAAFLATLEPRGLDEAVATVRGVQRAAEVLSRPGSPELQGEGFDVTSHEARLERLGSRHFAHIWYVVRATVALVRGRPGEALEALRQGAPLAPASRGMLHGAEHEYLEALALAFGAAPRSLPVRARVAATAARWASLARGCEANFGAKAALLAAEARRGLPGEASAYDEAIRLARRHGMPHVEGLALRRAGREQEARKAFERWGASV